MSQKSKRELVNAVRMRYRECNRPEKKQILDEIVGIAGYHRKYAIQMLNHPSRYQPRVRRKRKRQYDGRVVEALEKIWQTANFICGKRLAPVIPMYLDALEHHGELRVAWDVRQRLMKISPATIDRLLKRARQAQRPHGCSTTKPGTLLKHSIPIRTFAQWDDARPGFMEVDLVAHCGTSMRGEFLYSLNMVDVKTRWVECIGVQNRSQAAVSAAIATCQKRLPYPLLGLDSDNGGEFINDNLRRYCENEHITFTRGRSGNKNDQAYIEQKNWTVVRQMVGYDRYAGPVAVRALNKLYLPLRLYVNFFQPVMVLLRKERIGAKVRKYYDQAKTPYQRILDSPDVPQAVKERLSQQYLTLNPAALLREIHAAQDALWKLACNSAMNTMSMRRSSANSAYLP